MVLAFWSDNAVIGSVRSLETLKMEQVHEFRANNSDLSPSIAGVLVGKGKHLKA